MCSKNSKGPACGWNSERGEVVVGERGRGGNRNRKQTLWGLDGHLKNTALYIALDEERLEGFGQKTAIVTHLCCR